MAGENREKTEQGFFWERRAGSARIVGVETDQMLLEIPAQIEGLPVTEIGAQAFEGSGCSLLELPEGLERIGSYAFHDCNHLKEVRLPKSLWEVDSYAFYNCRGLSELSMWDGIRDLDNDAFLGCDKLTRIRMELPEGRHSSLKPLLSELYQEVEVTFVYPQKQREAVVVFPEYFVEYVENGPARIFEEFTIGSGRVYRKFFKDPEFDYVSYDRHFEIACKKDLAPQAARVAVRRLQYPWELGRVGEQRYVDWLREHAVEGLTQYVESESLDVLELMKEKGVLTSEIVENLLDLAIAGGKRSMISWLMQQRTQETRQKAERDFDL